MKTLKLMAVAAVAAAALTACSGDKNKEAENNAEVPAQEIQAQTIDVTLDGTVDNNAQLDSAIEQATEGQPAVVEEIDVNN